jgi:hypothetical protein
MVEIAISMAIVAFAMVAIMGVLPEGFKAQKSNRDETIINQEGAYFMEAIRGGTLSLDKLTNYVQWINVSNFVTDAANNLLSSNSVHKLTYKDNIYWYGSNIIGLLSTPKNTDVVGVPPGRGYVTVAAKVQAISGSVSQRYKLASDFQFTYLLRSEIIPYTNMPLAARTAILAPNSKNTLQERMDRTNAWTQSQQLQNNLYELRLTLNWPVRSDGKDGTDKVGSGQKVFRTLISGPLTIVPQKAAGTLKNLYFFQPSHYAY